MAQLKDLLVTGPARFLTKINADVAGNADTATKATNDSNGRNIVETYDTIVSVDNKIAAVQRAASGAQTTADSALSIANAAMPKDGGKFTGPISFQSSSLESSSLEYVTGIDAFANGGTLKWQSKSDFLKDYATTTALQNETSARQNADNLKTNTSVLPNDNGEIKTKYRISQKGYTNGATWYYKICDFPTNNSGNYASAILSGRIGGWTSGNMSYINALVWNRDTPGIALIDIAGAASATSSIWNVADLVLYTNGSSATAANTASLYVKCTGYFVFDLDLELFQSGANITYDGTYTTTTPSGTISGQSSNSTKRVEVINGKLYVNGKELPFSSDVSETYATKTELNTEISNRAAADDAIIADMVSKSNTGVQTIAGGLVIGATSTSGLSGTGVGRIMFTGSTNPLIGVQAIDSSGNKKTPYYVQSVASDDSLYIGPTSAKALKFDTNGNMLSPATLTIGGDITGSSNLNIAGRITGTGGMYISGRYSGSGDDEGIVIGPASNKYAGLTLGSPSGVRSVFYLLPSTKAHRAAWRYNNGSVNYSITHPETDGEIVVHTADQAQGSATQPVYVDSSGVIQAVTYSLNKTVPADAVFTDTVYTHPTTSGNKHIPSGGSSGQFLKWSSDGTATWASDNNTTYTFATGDSNGQIKITPSSGSATNVSVKGLGTAAYTASTAYATSAQGTKADNAMPKSGGEFTGNVSFSAGKTLDFINKDGGKLRLIGGSSSNTSTIRVVNSSNTTLANLLQVDTTTGDITGGTIMPKSGGTFSGDVTFNGSKSIFNTQAWFYKNPVIETSTSIADDGKARLTFQVKQTDNNITSSGHISVYDDGDAATNGTTMVIQSSGAMIIGGGESPSSAYSDIKETARTGENLYLTADNKICFYSNANTYANKKIGYFNAKGQFEVPNETGTNWVSGRDTAALTASKTKSGAYIPILSQKTTNGSFELGHYNNTNYHNQWQFVYATDTNYNAGTNTVVYGPKIDGPSGVLYGAAWNDYAEFRLATEKIELGRIVCENGDDTVSLSKERMQPGALATSDTYGFAIGEDNEKTCPIAVAGRVLVFPYEDRNTYKPGDPVCAGPNGTVSKMTREEVREYPDRMIGTVSAIPSYETWGTTNVEVKNRIWIKI